MKVFFIQRNFEGRSIFKVLTKQINQLPDVNMLPAELTVHLLELGFLASFMCKEQAPDVCGSVFDDAFGGLHTTILDEQAPINAILTKGSLFILAEAMAQFKAVLPMQRAKELLDATSESIDPAEY